VRVPTTESPVRITTPADFYRANEDERLAATEYLVASTDFETLCLWRSFSDKSKWVQLNPGIVHTVRYVKFDNEEWPINICGFWVLLDGHLVLFYTGSSMVVHYGAVKAWIEAAAPWRKGQVDAMNFGNCLNDLGIAR
jgi:hypothetical protein